MMTLHDPFEHFNIKEALSRLPNQPGVYRMYAKPLGASSHQKPKPIYIGKAKNLKSRVRSYFQKNAQHSPKNNLMIQQIHHFDFIVTESEVEALILESNLIKQYRPKYNVLLKDDKRFPWVCLTAEPFPRLIITRQVNRNKKSKARYFGPYSNAGAMYQTLRMLRKHFPLRQRRKPLFKDRPCMNYHIGTCPGPCQKKISPEEYAKTIEQVVLFLKGRTDELLLLIQKDMQEASDALNYEWAGKLRDRYQAVEQVMLHQQNIHLDNPALSMDIIGSADDDLRCAVMVLKVRQGKLIASQAHELPLLYGTSAEEAYESFLHQYYSDMEPDEIPDELVLQYASNIPDSETLLSQWLTSLKSKSKKVGITVPKLGTKKELLAMAIENAKIALEQSKLDDASRLRSDPSRALLELQEALGLPDYPSRMECYDISHVQGSYTVASMVVFIDGQPDKSEYKRFKIHSTEGKPDDFKSMEEVIQRRFKHTQDWDAPDLLVIDGGKGQLSSAMKALKSANATNQPIISLAKRLEEVFLPEQSRPHLLPIDSPALYLLQQIRDEAHRFAITYHRTLRGKGAKKSILDEIPGIGEKRKQLLLKHFGSLSQIKKASIQALTQAGLPHKIAETLHQALR